jgi:hypothetical protein
MIEFSKHHSFIPFVLFQRLDEFSHPVASDDEENEETKRRRSWNLKAIQASIPGVMLHSIIRETLNVLKQQFVVPMHMINIEHCVNCEKHSMTTWHVPGSYEKNFMEFKSAFRKSLPPAIIYANKFTADSTKSCPRLGSFEITIRPFASPISQLVFSKLSFKTIPPTDKIIRDLAVLLLPEVVKFQGEHLLELHTYDGYMKKPLKGATVFLYRLEVGVTLQKDVEDILGQKPYNIDALEAAGGVRVDKNGKRERVKLPPRRIANSSAGAKEDSAKAFTARVMAGNTVEDANFRHSSVFYKVRSWKMDEISAWFKSFAVGQEVVQCARMNGVVDGPSFLALASVSAFEKWGVKHKLKLFRMEKALEKLREGSNAQSSDPYTDCLDVGKDTIPVLCQPATPKPSYVTDDMLMYLVCSKKSDSRGLTFVNVDTAGTYVLRIEAPLSVPYCSNAFHIGSGGHSAYCASMKPRIGCANITIELEDDDELQAMAASGILLAMVNLTSGKRHISFAKTSHIEKDDTSDSDLDSPNKKKVTSFRPSRVSEEDEFKSKQRPLKRENSVGAILMRQMTVKSNTRWGITDGNNKPAKKLSEATAHLKATIWLPVGKYYSEVTGEVFSIDEDDRIDSTRNQYWDKASDGASAGKKEGNEPLEFVYSQHLAMKCHNRILSGSVKAFQKIYRHYKKDFLIANLWAFLALKKGLKRLLKRIRVKIADRSATRVQAYYRMRRAKNRHSTMRVCTVCAQAVIRKFLAIRRAKMLKRKWALIIRNTRWYAKRRRNKRRNGSIVIQCAFRCYQARVCYTNKLFRRRVLLKAKWWFLKVKKITLTRLAHEAELRREATENIIMAKEEKYMRDYEIKLAEFKQYLLRRRVAEVESNRMQKALNLQKTFRGFRERQALKNAQKIILRLQVL